jgi:maleate isomerase
MAHGYRGEEKIIKDWERKYNVPIVTAAQTQVDALHALNVKKILGVTYFVGAVNDITTNYFHDAGFDVLGMEGISVAFEDVGRVASQEIYAHSRQAFLKHPGAEAIYMLGTGWRCLDIIRLLEDDLQVPVIHPVPRAGLGVQKRLHVRQRVQGFGRLLLEMP